jgi:hypothetical protein
MPTSIHQPSFFPWLGLLDKIAKSDQFVFLDDVPANKASYQYRNIFNCNGSIQTITLPVDYRMDRLIKDLQFTNQSWKLAHLSKLKNYYLKAPFFKETYYDVENLYLTSKSNRPVDFIIESMRYLFEVFQISVQSCLSSSLNCTGNKGNLVLEICVKTGGTNYLSGRGAKNYMDDQLLNKFAESNIEVTWHQFKHPYYLQSDKYPFIEGLSALDLLFFEGKENANRIFWSNVNRNYDKAE